MAEPAIHRDSGAGGIDQAVAALRAGRLVVFPTDTVYGLAAHPGIEGATRRVFAAKQRSTKLALPVLVPDLEKAREVAVVDERAETLAAACWPGPVTLVLPRTAPSVAWDLGEEQTSVGVRVPDHPVALSLLRRTGPLAVTSANRSGEPALADCDDVLRSLGDAVAVYLCGGAAPGGVASTVVDLTGMEMHVMREGAIAATDIASMLRGEDGR